MNCLTVLSAVSWMVHDIGPDGARPGAGAAPALRMSRRSAYKARTVRDCAEGLLRSSPRSCLSGVTPLRRRDPSVCFSIGGPPKMPLIDVHPKRCEGLS
jgi:hypothetical protein